MGGHIRFAEEFLDLVLLLLALFLPIAESADFLRQGLEWRLLETESQKLEKKISKTGSLSQDDYEEFLRVVTGLPGGYHAELRHDSVLEYPCYELLSEEEWNAFFAGRNLKKQAGNLSEESVFLLPEEEMLCTEAAGWVLQEDSRELWAGGDQMLLPVDTAGIWEVRPVYPYQTVYVGEKLITMCYVSMEYGVYFAEAEEAVAETEGIMEQILSLPGICEEIPVIVKALPRILVCSFGHHYANTKERVEEAELTGRPAACPYCAGLPQSLELSHTVLLTEVGTPLAETDLKGQIFCMDGNTRTILPGEDGWQDNYDMSYCGMQTVTVRYYGQEALLTIITTGMPCRLCGALSECTLEDFEQYSLCASCLSARPVYLGKVRLSSLSSGTQEILAELVQKGTYPVRQGDFLQITVKARDGRIVSEKRYELYSSWTGDRGR